MTKQNQIDLIEEFYCDRIQYLVDNEMYLEAHSIFEEFVVNDEEPTDYLFIASVN
jgi:hypothetical protein